MTVQVTVTYWLTNIRTTKGPDTEFLPCLIQALLSVPQKLYSLECEFQNYL